MPTTWSGLRLGRVELLRSVGLAYSKLENDHGCILPVVDGALPLSRSGPLRR